jgi:hypothetical protein
VVRLFSLQNPPLLAGTGLVLARAAKAVLLRQWPWCDHDTLAYAALTGPIPTCATAWRKGGQPAQPTLPLVLDQGPVRLADAQRQAVRFSSANACSQVSSAHPRRMIVAKASALIGPRANTRPKPLAQVTEAPADRY